MACSYTEKKTNNSFSRNSRLQHRTLNHLECWSLNHRRLDVLWDPTFSWQWRNPCWSSGFNAIYTCTYILRILFSFCAHDELLLCDAEKFDLHWSKKLEALNGTYTPLRRARSHITTRNSLWHNCMEFRRFCTDFVVKFFWNIHTFLSLFWC